MRLQDGTFWQRVGFAACVALFAVGLLVSLADELERIGTPNVGWTLDTGYLTPTRDDASDAGLRGGGRALSINGISVGSDPTARGIGAGARVEIGATNTIVFETLQGTVHEVAISVRAWTWHDVLFTKGAVDTIGVLFFSVAAITFVMRPYQTGSWALLILGSLAAASMLTTYALIGDRAHFWTTVYFLTVVTCVSWAMLHAALAFPVVHPLLLRYPRVLWLLYGCAIVHAGLSVRSWYLGYPGLLAYVRPFSTTMLLLASVAFIGRCAHLAWRSKDPLVAQRARILVVGGVIGVAPFAVAQFLQQIFRIGAVDNRFLLWPLGIFVLALARVTVRQELMNARITVRKAVLYAGAVGVLTAGILAIIAVQPYAVPVLLFPVLYFWPRFDRRLNERLYPQRARFPELLRTLGADMSACSSIDTVLDTLAEAPRRLCDARASIAFLLADVVDAAEHVRSTAFSPNGAGRPLGDELLVQVLRTTRKEILRDHIAVEPQYSNIKDECYAGFDRLQAELLLPLTHQQRVVGGLAVGPRATGDVYETAEVDALSNAAQQAVQAIMRVEATERLRARELEFADLKRFFPPQIIDQVMARGGAAELRSQRKLVTLMFADLRGFTAFSDSVEPEEVMATLAEYHAAMGRRIAEFAGTLEHFEGDGFMVFFNDPVDQPDHAERAVGMALAMRADVERLRAGWRRTGAELHLGIGINSGYATCGFIGYEGRRDYAVIGNVTNLAARLCDTAGGGEILISSRVHAELGARYQVEPAGELTLKGFHQPQVAYRLCGPNGRKD